MRNLTPFLLALLLASGCSSSSGDPGAITSDAGTEDTGASATDGALDTASSSDTSTTLDSAPSDVGVDAAPINEPLFELVMAGETLTPTLITTEKVGTFSTKDPTVTGIARFKATLPKGSVDKSEPYLDFEIYTPFLGSMPYGGLSSTSQPGSVYLQYHYSRSGVSGFPKAQGPGMKIIRDGRDGWLEVTGSGTFDIDDAPRAFTLKVRQPIPKTS